MEALNILYSKLEPIGDKNSELLIELIALKRIHYAQLHQLYEMEFDGLICESYHDLVERQEYETQQLYDSQLIKIAFEINSNYKQL
jgi:hypothetical protein